MFDFDSVFLITAQSSLILGLIHGINPCGHSWLIIAPFVMGMTDGKRVFSLTFSFLLGTTVACLFIGLTLGAVSMMIPESVSVWVDYITAGIIILLGAILLIKPDLIHHHDHHHDHDHGHDHHHHEDVCNHNHKHEDGAHASCGSHCHHDHHHEHGISGFINRMKKKMSFTAMFIVGFVNMIIPCPTVAIMYKYAVDSGSYLKATTIFGIYAIATAIAVGGVIYAIFRATNAFYTLQKEWIESAVMRTAGAITLFFGIWTLL